jgi:hypothetical protein
MAGSKEQKNCLLPCTLKHLSFLKPFFEKWKMRGIVEKTHLKRNSGIPKDCFSFGLCDSQKAFSSWYFGKKN